MDRMESLGNNDVSILFTPARKRCLDDERLACSRCSDGGDWGHATSENF